MRAWQAEAGEYFHPLDGQLGGMWRRSRRPPQQLAGVGFSAQGLFEGTHFRRLPASHDPAFAWMFAGIDTDVLGDYGLSGGGAAGFEFDRADRDLGTDGSPGPRRLSGREREVLQLMADGKATKEAAAALRVSVKTVETHRASLMNKLNLFSVAELTKFAVRHGMSPL